MRWVQHPTKGGRDTVCKKGSGAEGREALGGVVGGRGREGSEEAQGFEGLPLP